MRVSEKIVGEGLVWVGKVVNFKWFEWIKIDMDGPYLLNTNNTWISFFMLK